ncbi:MAG: hypothetical protein ACYC35_13270 [Pirellulales bacterium]
MNSIWFPSSRRTRSVSAQKSTFAMLGQAPLHVQKSTALRVPSAVSFMIVTFSVKVIGEAGAL